MTNKQAATRIVRQLQDAGYQALFAGGCVRDMLLGRAAKDYDVATDARPKEVLRMFEHTLRVGAKFGVVIVIIARQQVEVATFRADARYVDGRRPCNIRFANVTEDAKRRDFTVNAMYYDPVARKVIDCVGGQLDLKRGIIRTVGEPSQRFLEDYLRMLRAIRFSTELGFVIEPRTWSAICRHSANITKISGERIAMEMEAILAGPNRALGASLLIKSGLAEAIFPGFCDQGGESAMDVLANLKKRTNFALSLGCFFSGCDTDFAIERCRFLKLSRSHNRHVRFLLSNRGMLLKSQVPLAQLKLMLSEPYFWDLYEFERAIQKSCPSGGKGLRLLTAIRKRIKQLGNVELKPKPLLNGHDLMRLGAVPGPLLGQLAGEMYVAQLEGNLQNKTEAEQWVCQWLDRHKTVNN